MRGNIFLSIINIFEKRGFTKRVTGLYKMRLKQIIMDADSSTCIAVHYHTVKGEPIEVI